MTERILIADLDDIGPHGPQDVPDRSPAAEDEAMGQDEAVAPIDDRRSNGANAVNAGELADVLDRRPLGGNDETNRPMVPRRRGEQSVIEAADLPRARMIGVGE